MCGLLYERIVIGALLKGVCDRVDYYRGFVGRCLRERIVVGALLKGLRSRIIIGALSGIVS